MISNKLKEDIKSKILSLIDLENDGTLNSLEGILELYIEQPFYLFSNNNITIFNNLLNLNPHQEFYITNNLYEFVLYKPIKDSNKIYLVYKNIPNYIKYKKERKKVDFSFKKKVSGAIHKTHKGKNYTKEEWEKYEQEQWEQYKKTHKFTSESDKQKWIEEQKRQSLLYDEEEDRKKKLGGKGFFLDERDL